MIIQLWPLRYMRGTFADLQAKAADEAAQAAIIATLKATFGRHIAQSAAGRKGWRTRKGIGEVTSKPAVYPRDETIKCPQCGNVQTATVEFEEWMPFPAYVHTCGNCLYTITESEWEVTK